MTRWGPIGLKGHVPLGTLESLAWGEVEERDARHLLRHVQSCRWCRRRWEWVRRLPGTLVVATQPTPSRDPSSVLRRRARGERVLLPVDASPAEMRRPDPGYRQEADR
jgi:hypothetical protein